MSEETAPADPQPEAPASTTFVCPRAASFKIRIGGKYHRFLNGRLVLSGDDAEELKAGVLKTGSSLSQWIQIVSLETAEAIVAAHQAQQSHSGAVKGGVTAGILAERSKPNVVDMQTQLRAKGVPESEISHTNELLREEGFAVTEKGQIPPVEVPAEVSAPAPVPLPSAPAVPPANGLDLLQK